MTMQDIESLVAEVRSALLEGGDILSLRYDRALEKLAEIDDDRVIVSLCSVFDDQSEWHEEMFNVIHVIEGFETETYVRRILEASKDLAARAPEWAETIFIRILNHDETREELVRQVRGAPETTRAVVRMLMHKINEEGDQFPPKTAPVLEAAG